MGNIIKKKNKEKRKIETKKTEVELQQEFENKGMYFMMKNEDEEANKAFEKAIELGSTSCEVYNNVSIYYIEKGDLKKALFFIQKGLEIKKIPQAYNTEGTIYQKLEMYNEAIYSFEEAIKLDENYIEPQTNLAIIYYTFRDNYEKAMEIFKKLDKRGVENINLDNAKGGFHFKLGEYKRAIEWYEKALKKQDSPEKFADAKYNIALSHEKLGELDKALNKYIEIEDKFPNKAKIYLNKGNVYAKQKKLTEAMLEYNKAKEISPNDEEINNVIGAFYLENNELEKALEKFKEIIKFNPNYESVYNNIGNVYYYKTNYIEALKNYNKSLELNPTSEVTLYNKVISLKKIGVERVGSEILKLIQNEKKYQNKNLIYELGDFLIDYYDQEKIEDNKKKIIDYFLNNEMFLYVKILKKISDRKDSISELFPRFEEQLKQNFKSSLLKEDIFYKMKNIDYNNIYYMCKGINKYTIESLVNMGIYKNNVNNFNDPFDPYLKKYNTILNEECKKIKVTCFSQKNDNLLLWAHYANNHKGLCLGYKLNDKDSKVFFDKVIYKEIETELQDSYLVEKGMSEEIGLKENILTLKELYLRKHKDWAYEDEYRLIYFDINDEDVYYKNVELKEVIFGMDSSKSDEELIKKIVNNIYGDGKIKFFRMTQGENLTLKREII